MNTPDKAYKRGQVLEIIQSVINKMDGGGDDKRDIYLHIAELAETINTLKKEISESRPHNVKSEHVPGARDELDAVVAATADATNAIMGACEGMEELAATLEDDKKDKLTGLVTDIYEACTFQDITGQRIGKVIVALREIEEKVERIMQTLSDTVGPLKLPSDAEEKTVSVDDEESLLNGPQMADKAITQEEIDRLLAEFD